MSTLKITNYTGGSSSAAKKTEKLNKKELAELARRVAEDFDSLCEMLPKDGHSFFDGVQDIDTLDIIDKLNSIKYQLKAQSDGRPQPLDFSGLYYVPDSNNPPQLEERLKENAKQYREWAHCIDRGYRQVAHIGGLEASMDELIVIRDWCDDVIKWHIQKPKKKGLH